MFSLVSCYAYESSKTTSRKNYAKKLVNDLNYDGITFSVGEKDFSKLEMENDISFNVLVMKINRPFQSTFQIKNLKVKWICCP